MCVLLLTISTLLTLSQPSQANPTHPGGGQKTADVLRAMDIFKRFIEAQKRHMARNNILQEKRQLNVDYGWSGSRFGKRRDESEYDSDMV